MLTIRARLHIFLTLLFITTTPVWAEEIPKFFTFTFENDLFFGNDNGYTNGAGITFGKGPFQEFSNDNLPLWLSWLAEDLYVSTIGGRTGVVFNDILIDGNTFRDSHSASLEHLQDQISAGVVWNIGHWAYVFQISSLSSRTKLSDEREEFGALSVTVHY